MKFISNINGCMLCSYLTSVKEVTTKFPNLIDVVYSVCYVTVISFRCPSICCKGKYKRPRFIASVTLVLTCSYRSSTFFMSKIIHVYLFRGILFLFLSTSTKIFEHELFFSLEAYPAIRLTDFSRLSSLLSGMPVQVKHYIIFTWSNYSVLFIFIKSINNKNILTTKKVELRHISGM